MKVLFLIFFLLLSISAKASFKSSDQEKSLTTKEPMISKSVFQRTIINIGKEFKELPDWLNEKLLIYADWNSPTADSALARRWDNAQLLVYRGMAHRREIDPDSLALIVCHELGHLYAGAPLKPEGNYIAAEGQADYFATRYCLRRALATINPENIHERSLLAIHRVGAFLANNWGHSHPSFKSPDTNRVNKTILDHPEPQCRFDTFWAGYNGMPRPACWFAP
ncbi:MAG: hypothetical protein VX642_02080 [Bdellovibrionota bacterium]|nr:hypothetical protein [Bdellovibrionota bacterium]